MPSIEDIKSYLENGDASWRYKQDIVFLIEELVKTRIQLLRHHSTQDSFLWGKKCSSCEAVIIEGEK